MRFRRVLKGLNLDARNASTAWRPYFGLELDPYSESFVVMLNAEGTRLTHVVGGAASVPRSGGGADLS